MLAADIVGQCRAKVIDADGVLAFQGRTADGVHQAHGLALGGIQTVGIRAHLDRRRLAVARIEIHDRFLRDIIVFERGIRHGKAVLLSGPLVWSKGGASGSGARDTRPLFRMLMPSSDDRTKTICKHL